MKTKYRHDIKNKDVKKDLKSGRYSVARLARKYGCSESIIRRIRDDKREVPTYNQNKIPPEERCWCCKHRPIWREGGLKKLCELCFKHKDRGLETYSSPLLDKNLR